MKTRLIIAIVCGLAALTGCSKMNDLHREFLERGETVYAAKADSVKAFIGIGKQHIDVYPPRHRASSGLVTWNVGADSLEFDIPEGTTGAIHLIIPDLEEGSYTYDITLFDSFGNRSIPTEVTSSVVSQETMDEMLSVMGKSASYEIYSDIASYYEKLMEKRPDVYVSAAQVYNGRAMFKWGTMIPGTDVSVVFRYMNTSEQWVTRTYNSTKIKPNTACSDFTDAYVADPEKYKFYYQTTYADVAIDPAKAAATFSGTLDLGEDYADRYIPYREDISIATIAAAKGIEIAINGSKATIVYPEVEDDWIQ